MNQNSNSSTVTIWMYFWLGFCEFSHRLALLTLPTGIKTCGKRLNSVRCQKHSTHWSTSLIPKKKYLVRNSDQISSGRSNSDRSITAEGDLVSWNEEQPRYGTSCGWQIALECLQQLFSSFDWEIFSENSFDTSSSKDLCTQAQFSLHSLWDFGP